MMSAMKAAFLLGLVLLPLGVVQAADSAYSALRVLGKRDGQDILNHVIQVRGKGGNPEPQVWKIVINDPRARGGVREVEIEKGKIVSERTPTATHGAGSPMNFNQLNLDSEGAFTVANQEAQKGHMPFDRIDYVLRSGTGGGAPVWELDLSDGKTGRTGNVEIAADSGAVLHRDFDTHQSEDRAFVDGGAPPPGGPPGPPPAYGAHGDDDERYSKSGEPIRNLPDFFHRIGKHMEKRERQLQNFFTGKGGTNPDDGR
jgi:hypothetical protein